MTFTALKSPIKINKTSNEGAGTDYHHVKKIINKTLESNVPFSVNTHREFMQANSFVPSLDLTSEQKDMIIEFLEVKYTEFIKNNVSSQVFAMWELLLQYLKIIIDTTDFIIKVLVSSFFRGGSNLFCGKMVGPLAIDEGNACS